MDDAVQRVLTRFDNLGRQAHRDYDEKPDAPWDRSPLIARDKAFLEAARIVTEELGAR